MRRDDFRFNPDRRIIEPIGRSSGGFGITFEPWGRLYETHNTRHILHQVFPGRYAAGLPARRLGQLDEVSDHEEGGLARIFAIGVQTMRVNHPEQADIVAYLRKLTSLPAAIVGRRHTNAVRRPAQRTGC